MKNFSKVLVISFIFFFGNGITVNAQCDPTPTVNLNYVSGTGASCIWNYTYSISYGFNNLKYFQFSVSLNGGAATPITGCLALSSPGVTTGTTNNFTAPCTNGTRLALTITYGTANNCGGSTCTEPASTITLPVKITAFQLKWSGITPCLQWIAEAEERIFSYNIEYSENGQDFVQAGSVMALNSTSTTTYNFCDPQNKKFGFYRLKINEIGGRSNYTEVIRFSNSVDKPEIYPNPVLDKLFFTIKEGSYEGPARYSIFNSAGKLVITGHSFSNFINVMSLSPGLYFLQLQTNQENTAEKVSFIKR